MPNRPPETSRPLHPPPLQVLYEARDWKGLGEYVVLLSKRRGQLKQAVQAMVRQCMGYLPGTPDQVGRGAVRCGKEVRVCGCVCCGG